MLLSEQKFKKPESPGECLAVLHDAGESGQMVAGRKRGISDLRQKLFRPEAIHNLLRWPAT
jgi:hypothetical protein